jgi:hypothetical protein
MGLTTPAVKYTIIAVVRSMPYCISHESHGASMRSLRVADSKVLWTCRPALWARRNALCEVLLLSVLRTVTLSLAYLYVGVCIHIMLCCILRSKFCYDAMVALL